jgi:hypothetical protein
VVRVPLGYFATWQAGDGGFRYIIENLKSDPSEILRVYDIIRSDEDENLEGALINEFHNSF